MAEDILSPYIIRKQMETYDLKDKVKIITDVDICEDEIYKEDHDAMPIKKQSDLLAISNYFIANKQYRNNLLFTMGIHFGLRSSDLRRVRFYHIIDKDGHLKKGFDLLEQKTCNTRKRKTNKILGINEAVARALVLYLENTDEKLTLNDYIFRSESNNKKLIKTSESDDSQEIVGPISRQAIEDIIKGVTKKLGIEGRYNTHSLRKTFGYHFYKKTGDVVLLQKIFGHSSPLQTLTYIGVTREDILQAYEDLNLLAFEEVVPEKPDLSKPKLTELDFGKLA